MGIIFHLSINDDQINLVMVDISQSDSYPQFKVEDDLLFKFIPAKSQMVKNGNWNFQKSQVIKDSPFCSISVFTKLSV